MTQNSIPQQGHLSDGVSPDAGPYSAFQWSEIWRQLFTNDPNHGPVGLTGDTTLLVTNPSGTTINVAPGIALVAGHFFSSDGITSFGVTPPVGDSRIDTVVVVHNESISPVTSGVASGNALLFPTVLTDYGGNASIPPYSARIAILQGTPATTPVAPALDQDPSTLHMIPLADYQINNAGVIAGLTDTRDYAVTSGGGSVYAEEYLQNTARYPYQGRIRITPVYLKFSFGAGAHTKAINFIGEPNTTLDVDKYATFVSWNINDFDIITSWGDAYRIYVAIWSGTPDYLEFQCVRGGYVDNAGVAQPPPLQATDVYGTVTLLQMLDQPPLEEGGFPGALGTGIGPAGNYQPVHFNAGR